MSNPTRPSAKPQTFGELLRAFRLRAKKTQKDLGEAISVDVTYVSKLERPTGPKPTQETIQKAADFLGLSADERDELHRLAERVPSHIEQMVVREPAAARLFRSIRKYPEAEWESLLNKLIDDLERGTLHPSAEDQDLSEDDSSGRGDEKA